MFGRDSSARPFLLASAGVDISMGLAPGPGFDQCPIRGVRTPGAKLSVGRMQSSVFTNTEPWGPRLHLKRINLL